MLITYRIAKHLRSVDILNEYRLYCGSITLFSAVFTVINAIMFGDYTVNYVYLVLKTLSILANIILFAMIMHKIYRLMRVSPTTAAQRTVSTGSQVAAVGNPVYVLVSR